MIHERPQDTECEWPQPMSKIRKLSDGGVGCQGGGTWDAKRRKLNVFITDSQTLQTLFVNTSSSNFLLSKQSDQDSADEVNTAATQATNGGMKRKDESESNPIVIS